MVDLADSIFRDFETDGVPSSGKHKPIKSKIREWGAFLEAGVGNASSAMEAIAEEETARIAADATEAAARTAADSQLSSRIDDIEDTEADSIARATWSALSAITGSRVGQRGFVPTSDAGTHTDPVVGGTVNNSGTFAWSASPAGWQRIDNYQDISAVTADIAGLHGETGDLGGAVFARQIIGNSRALVSGGAFAGDNVLVLGTPVAKSGYLLELNIYGVAAKQLLIKRFTKSGDNFTQVGPDYSVGVTTGLDKLTRADFGNIPVNANEYIGFYSTAGSPIGRTITSSGAGDPLYTSATSSGNVSSFTDAAVDTSFWLQMNVVVGGLVESESRISEAERRLKALVDAIVPTAIATDTFNPGLIFASQLGAWYDFAAASTLFQNPDGTTAVGPDAPIGYVFDKSGNGFDFTASGTARPTLRALFRNGNHVAEFDGVDNILSGKRLDMTRNRNLLTVFAVVNFDDISGEMPVITHQIDNSGAAVRAGLYQTNGSGRPRAIARQTDAGSSATASGYNGDTGNWVIVEAQFHWSLGLVRVYLNGGNSVEGLASLPGTALSPDTPERFAFIGGNQNVSSRLDGKIGEIFEVVGALDATKRNAAYAYLSKKWAIDYVGPKTYSATGPLQGAWTWFNDPRVWAVSEDRAAVGVVTPGGSVMVGDYDFAAGTISHSMLHSMMQIDDHNNPGFAGLADGTIIAAYCKHGIDELMYFVKSTAPGDPSAWGTPVDIGQQIVPGVGTYAYSYANLYRLSGESDRLYLFFRAGTVPSQESWYVSTSDDDGVTWTAGQAIAGPDRPYSKFVKNGESRIDWLFNDGHPGAKPNNNTYHAYFEGGNLYKSDGTLIAAISSLPINFSTDPTLVYDAVSEGLGRSWVHDIVADPDTNRPVACFTVMPTINVDNRYHQARWNGAAWTHHQIATAGGDRGLPGSTAAFYSGSVITDPEDIDIVYCSRKLDANGNAAAAGTFALFRYVSADNGVTWTGTRLTFGTEDCFLPYIPPGMRKLFYLKGKYDSFSDYFTEIAVMDLPA